LINIEHGVQDISLYAHAWRPSKATPASSKAHT